MPKKPTKTKSTPALAAFMQRQPPMASASKAPTAVQKAALGKRKALGDGRIQMLVYLHPDGVRELKQAVLDGDAESLSAAVADAVNAWFIEHKRPPVA